MGTGIYDLLAVASLTFHELDCQHTENVPIDYHSLLLICHAT